MPGWHEATIELQKQNKLRMVGILQEQHPARARLFMQWKRMGWPLLVDSMNLLGVAVVPITVLVDEHGIVRKVRARPSDLESFLEEDFEAPAAPDPAPERVPLEELRAAALAGGSPKAWRAYARSIVLWRGPADLDAAIDAFGKALELEPDDPVTHFQLGVAYRHRYDSDRRQNEDFQLAAHHWTRALDLEPNQYIWRRRIQQYGPRLDKPYPFYDWVETARAEIRSRGQEPEKLRVEPSGTELAHPAKSFETAEAPEEPDPGGRIRRDERGFIDVEQVVVPARIRAGEPGRIHLVFRPNGKIKAHWNNEAEDMKLWIEPPEGWEVDRRFETVARPREVTSTETRRVEFEVRSPEDAKGKVRIPTYALYYVCEDVDGTCLYRRRDVEVEVEVVAAGP